MKHDRGHRVLVVELPPAEYPSQLGEHPEFTRQEIAILRGFIAENWHRVHREKNQAETQVERDDLTRQLLRLEQLGEKVGAL